MPSTQGLERELQEIGGDSRVHRPQFLPPAIAAGRPTCRADARRLQERLTALKQLVNCQ